MIKYSNPFFYPLSSEEVLQKFPRTKTTTKNNIIHHTRTGTNTILSTFWFGWVGFGWIEKASHPGAETATDRNETEQTIVVLARTIMTRTTEDDENDDDDDETAEREALNLIALFCETAILVEEEILAMGNGPGTKHSTAAATALLAHSTESTISPSENNPTTAHSKCSPFYLACKRNAPLTVLRTLLKTRSSQTTWIAPRTGGEPNWATSSIGDRAQNASSPLEILLREDRVRHYTNCHRQ